MVATAKRGNKQYLTVVLGEPSTIDRTEKAALILEHAFSGKAKKIGKRVDRYNPRPTRTTPVNLRPVICGGNSKIRTYQLVTPQPKPKRGIFARNKYVSPQRKSFGSNLGDKSHPQGALVYAPKGRKYRSHILQPRRARDILRVHTGVGRRVTNAKFTINQSKKARKRQKDQVVENVSTNASASAFANAKNGVGAAAPSSNGSLLNQNAKSDAVRETGVIASSPSGNLSGVLLPRPNPIR